jgi:4-amino-4-deoxy-L-arabinose transferase-like glycosyltransferase
MYTRLTGMSKTESDTRMLVCIVALVGLTLLWRTLRFALVFPLFGDEAFVANNFLVRDFAGLTQGLEHYQIVPLLYLWGTLSVSKIAGTSEWALRLLSFAAGAASVFVYVRIAFDLLPRKAALVALAIFCASYYPVRHAVEVKPYSFDLLASLCITMMVVAYARSRSYKALGAWAIACTFGVWASYPAVFVAIGSCLALATQPRHRRPAVFVAAGTALSFLLMYAWIGSEQRAAGRDVLVNLELWASTFPPWSEPSRLPGWFVHTHLGKMFAYPNGGSNGGSTLTFVLFCIGAWAVWRNDRLKVLILVGPFPLMLVAASFEAYPYGGSARVAQHVAPAICLLAGAGLARLLRLTSAAVLERRLGLVVAISLVLMIGGLVRDAVKPYKELSDRINRQVVTLLARDASPGVPWIVYGAWGDQGGRVPNLYDWAGSAARLRYYLLREAGDRLYWGPGPEALSALRGGAARLLVYRHPYVPFPGAAFGAYLGDVGTHFETAGSRVYPFREGDEQLTVLDLEPRPR